MASFDPMAAMLATNPGVAMAYGSQAQTNVTDLSSHVSGGNSQAVDALANQNASDDARAVLHTSAAFVIIALALLWVMGAVVLKGV